MSITMSNFIVDTTIALVVVSLVILVMILFLNPPGVSYCKKKHPYRPGKHYKIYYYHYIREGSKWRVGRMELSLQSTNLLCLQYPTLRRDLRALVEENCLHRFTHGIQHSGCIRFPLIGFCDAEKSTLAWGLKDGLKGGRRVIT